MRSNTGIAPSTEQKGYRRGLILGFTMAESMLLLVFCLLLAAGALIMKVQEDLKIALSEKAELRQSFDIVEREKKETEKQLSLLDEEVKLLRLSTNAPKETKDAWRELTIARQAISDMEEHRLTLQEAVDQAELFRLVLDSKMNADDIKQAKILQDELEEKKVSLEDFRELVEAAEKLKTLDFTEEEVAKLEPAVDLIKSELLSSEDKTSKEILEQLIADAEKKSAGEKARLAMERAKQQAEERAKLAETANKPHDWPPIINLSEANQYSFRSGSAELSPRFREAIEQKVATQIAETAKQYGVDVIEVIGHTDEQGMGKRQSNMDYDLKPVLDGTAPVTRLQPGDNAGLGLARAIAVSQALKSHPDLVGFTILPMSGAQLILPNDSLTDGAQAGDAADRRRIEIRVRKRNAGRQIEDLETVEPTQATVDAQLPPLTSRTVRSVEIFTPAQ